MERLQVANFKPVQPEGEVRKVACLVLRTLGASHEVQENRRAGV